VELRLLRLRPHTGRKHQLRLHCQGPLSSPIVGDVLYGEERDEEEGETASHRLTRSLGSLGMMLHAHRIRIPHPVYTEIPEQPYHHQHDPSTVGSVRLVEGDGASAATGDGTANDRTTTATAPTARVWVEASTGEALPERFRSFMAGECFTWITKARVSRVDDSIKAALPAPCEVNPSGEAICGFYSYGCCTHGVECEWDHTHCHACGEPGHTPTTGEGCAATTDWQAIFTPDAASRRAILHRYLNAVPSSPATTPATTAAAAEAATQQ